MKKVPSNQLSNVCDATSLGTTYHDTNKLNINIVNLTALYYY